MRVTSLKFEQLVQENKQDILKDNQRLSEIEARLDKKQADFVKEERNA
ncbi:Fur-regulated basic protein B [Lentibacillus halodurans]|uniref:Fur-regulated basic protein B n=1 Tax=Lentibacillus halodurans TaxID=237679 RepID=A0A1I0YLC0_9BACI|nr:FbpB family small basic protein [Lentibacillus halodurans]SFB13992.1 Fur-regulated basic protein B [Lentibacillus halodurans]